MILCGRQQELHAFITGLEFESTCCVVVCITFSTQLAFPPESYLQYLYFHLPTSIYRCRWAS